MALINKLSAIGDAIREKTGKSELLTLEQMPLEIASIQGGGGGDDDVEPIVLTGNANYACSGQIACAYLEKYGDTVSTNDISSATNMFSGSTLKSIPFEINFADGGGSMASMFHSCKNLKYIPDIDCKHNSYTDISYIFAYCNKLEQLPYLYNVFPTQVQYLFSGCNSIREFPEDYFDNWNLSRCYSYKYSYESNTFSNCGSLRKYPMKLFSNINKNVTVEKSQSFYSNMATNCYSLDELTDIPVYIFAPLTTNKFNQTVANCHRLKEFTFETQEDGTPYIAQWKNQNIPFYSGYVFNDNNLTYILKFNSGITADKEVIDDATYQALKNNPDWFTQKQEYSRYNHDSAVNTINSLPDTSAYLATSGGTNTIVFDGASGSATDGGAINTLTEEEIAVAAAKGWTVSFS